MVNTLLSLIVFLSAQAAAPAQAPAAPQPAASFNATYLIGVSDVLAIKVFNEEQMTNKYTVDTDGSITFPLIGRFQVGGKTTRQIEEDLTRALQPDWLKRAQVSVEIAQYRSRSIYVLGEVRNPAKYNIEGQTTLLEVIAQAGSFTPNAAQTINVLRYKDGLTGVQAGAPVVPGDPRGAEILRVSQEDLREGRLSANIILHDGDTIFVPAAEKFYVMGFVKTPGQFVLQPGMTVRQAISMAGGLSERGSNRRIKIIRKVEGKDVELDAEMSDLVQPNDTIRVPQRLI